MKKIAEFARQIIRFFIALSAVVLLFSGISSGMAVTVPVVSALIFIFPSIPGALGPHFLTFGLITKWIRG